MLCKAIVTLILAAILSNVQGQEISSRTADSLVRSLRTSDADTSRMDALIRLADYQVMKPGELKKDMDSAFAYLDRAEKLNLQLKDKKSTGHIYLTRGQIYRESGDAVTGRPFVESALAILKKEPDQFLLGKCVNELASFYTNEPDQIDKKIALKEQAQKIYEAAGLTERSAYLLRDIGDLYLLKNNIQKALQILNRSLTAYQKIHYSYLPSVYVLIGKCYFTMGDFEQALKFQLLALKYADEANDHSLQYCEINNHIGLTYFSLKEFQNAVPYFNIALETAYTFHHVPSIYIISHNIADSYLRLGKPEQALRQLDKLTKTYAMPNESDTKLAIATVYIKSYIALRAYSKAMPYIHILTGMINRQELPDYNLNLARLVFAQYYTATRQYPLALKNLKESLLSAQRESDPVTRAKIYNFWFTLDTAQKNYAGAVTHLLLFNKLNDTLFNETKSKQIQQWQIVYETAQKENHIKILQEEDNLHRHELAQSIQSKKFYATGIILLLLLLGVGYSRYRIKQRNNIQLEVKQKEISAKNLTLERLLRDNEWLLREVHHRVKNNLQIVMSLLTSQSVYLKDEAALSAVMESQHRIQAMSLIHQKLYKNNNISNIYMPDYINDLVDYLKDSYKTQHRIHFERQVAAIHLDIAQAIPLGLILNEAITNAVKHAFPYGQDAVIKVEMYDSSIDEIILTVSDNGIGLPPEFESNTAVSFGITLMRGLVDDLGGTFKIDSSNGTMMSISFKKEIGLHHDLVNF